MSREYILLEKISEFLKQGYTIKNTLDICKDLVDENIINQIVSNLDSGKSLEEAILLLKTSKIFKVYFKFFIQKNEISKAINQSLKIIKMRDNLKKRLKKQLTYPLFLLIFLIFFSTFINYSLLPQVTRLFTEFSIKQTIFQEILFLIFKIIPFLLIICIAALISIMFVSVYSIKKQRYKLIDYLIKFNPIVGNWIKKYYSIKFSIYYNELLIEGYTSNSIINILYEQVEDKDIKMLVYEINKGIENGENLYTSLASVPYFEDVFLKHFKLMLKSIVNDKDLHLYIDLSLLQLEKFIENSLKIIVPGIYGFVAIFVITVYLSIIVPMLKIIETI